MVKVIHKKDEKNTDGGDNPQGKSEENDEGSGSLQKTEWSSHNEEGSLHEKHQKSEHDEMNIPQVHVLAASPKQGAMILSSKVVKIKITKSTKKKTTQAVTSNVTRC